MHNGYFPPPDHPGETPSGRSQEIPGPRLSPDETGDQAGFATWGTPADQQLPGLQLPDPQARSGAAGQDTAGLGAAGHDAAGHDAAGLDAAGRDATARPGAPGPGLQASLEAIMLVADEPVSEVIIAEVLELPREQVASALRELALSYAEQQRGFDLREVAGGWRFYTREEYAPVVERFVSDGLQVRLTQAALETLAVVAYRQPVSRSRASAVRGVNCDGVMRTLALRGLVEEAGADPETGAILFQTTGYFLERLGLPGLEDLPDLAPFLPDQPDDEQEPGHEHAEP
jgi:segregation and condensation protein B